MTCTPGQISWPSNHMGLVKREEPTKEEARSQQKLTTLNPLCRMTRSLGWEEEGIAVSKQVVLLAPA